MKRHHKLGYTALIVLSAVVSQVSVMLAAGQLPLPTEWLPFVPLLSAAVTALSTQLPAWRKGATEVGDGGPSGGNCPPALRPG